MFLVVSSACKCREIMDELSSQKFVRRLISYRSRREVSIRKKVRRINANVWSGMQRSSCADEFGD